MPNGTYGGVRGEETKVGQKKKLSFPDLLDFPFPLAHSPKRQPCVAWLTVFREKSRWKPAQAYRKMNLPYPCLSRPHGVFPKR